MRAGDTIFAPAAGGARSALTVLRVSGPATMCVLTGLCGGAPPARRASLRVLRDAEHCVIDRGIVLWFPAPASYTGEDSAELHAHGGRAVLDALADALTALGARPAEPGEFTRRAMLNGRLDLLAAEAVGDLTAAETQAQRRQALRQMEGAQSALYADWRQRLIRIVAQQEAAIDFPDEDLPEHLADAQAREVGALRAAIRSHLEAGRSGERLRDGLVFAVIGAPNVGKSSLINALAGRDVAIVAATPGTTRDVLETRVVLADAPVTLLDTAGLRESADPVEMEGIRRARARAKTADLTIAVVSAACPGEPPCGDLIVANKCDLAAPPEWAALGISAATGAGIARLRSELARRAADLTTAEGPPVTRARHRAALEEVCVRLADAAAAPLPELAGEDLRIAAAALGGLTGAMTTEDVLDAVFAQFCIGK